MITSRSLSRLLRALKNKYFHSPLSILATQYLEPVVPATNVISKKVDLGDEQVFVTPNMVTSIVEPRIHELPVTDTPLFHASDVANIDLPSARTVFSPFQIPVVEEYNLTELSASTTKFLHPQQRLQPHHLALLDLFPAASFDYGRLLHFNGKSLFPFQKEGVLFLLQRTNALLADEMGLGKSIQAIVALRLLFGAAIIRRGLVVCPKSVLTDWRSKFEEWAPELTVTKVSGTVPSRRAQWTQDSNIFLVTYDSLKEDVLASNVHTDQTPLAFDLVVLDEVQRIKNRSTKTFHAINQIQGRIRWGLSGTPLENRIDEILAIFSYLMPGLFQSFNISNSAYVKSMIEPFTLRRTKNAVLQDLPKKSHDKVLLDLGPKQRTVYRLAETRGVIALKEKGQTITVTHIMALISQLKQICNIEPVSGESCKLEYIDDVLQNLAETGEKMILFSQYPEKTLKLIAPRLRRFNPLLYHGSLTNKQREAVITQFEEDETIRVLLMSLKAGGLGLTLTAANYVAHFDSWWNPAAMSQAEDRTHRIGQHKNVFVLSLITRDTIEERIQQVLEDKRTLFKEVVGEISDEGLTRLLTEKDLFGLFGLQRTNNN